MTGGTRVVLVFPAYYSEFLLFGLLRNVGSSVFLDPPLSSFKPNRGAVTRSCSQHYYFCLRNRTVQIKGARPAPSSLLWTCALTKATGPTQWWQHVPRLTVIHCCQAWSKDGACCPLLPPPWQFCHHHGSSLFIWKVCQQNHRMCDLKTVLQPLLHGINPVFLVVILYYWSNISVFSKDQPVSVGINFIMFVYSVLIKLEL